MCRSISILLIIFFTAIGVRAQSEVFSRQDTLRGSITAERIWWDLSYYHLSLSVNPADSTIQGNNVIQYNVLDTPIRMQIDLQPPLKISKVLQGGREISFKQDGNAWFIDVDKSHEKGTTQSIQVFYSGKPHVSTRPPWSGGFTWNYDSLGLPYVATTCQGIGASLWWPCKDHMYDEVDSMAISITVPENLYEVSNGRLRSIVQNNDGTRTFNWFVNNPINNYGVNVNIADYVTYAEQYQGEKGTLDLSYYVRRENLEKAKIHFKEVPRMMEAFEHWFGPYPFYEDGFKLVEVPYAGMEHQSSVTYGNYYKNGYRGRDVSGTNWGFKFDFIIVHESGHEWFANNITQIDIADMWIHEGFTAYSENLFLDYHFGTRAAEQYVIGTRDNINNDKPIIGRYDVNSEGSADMYYKGSNLLHTLRQLVDDDEKWRAILRKMNEEFYHKTVSTEQIESFLSRETGINLSSFFNQYLRDVRIPTFQYAVEKKALKYRWSNCIEGFDMKMQVKINGEDVWLAPITDWQTLDNRSKKLKLKVNPNFLVQIAINP